MSCSIASYNILDPFLAVKWGVENGLNDPGLSTRSENLQSSIKSNTWEIYSNWNRRVLDICKNIDKTKVDILCLQEVNPSTLNKILEITENYFLASEGYHHSPVLLSNSSSNLFGNAVLYNANKIEFNDSFTLDYHFGNRTRRAACASFNLGEKIIQIASVHLTGYNPLESDFFKKQISKQCGFNELNIYTKEMEERIDNKAIDALVIGGDFNEDPNEANFDLYRPKYLTNLGYLYDGNLEPTEPSKNRKIDWIFTKPILGNFTLHSMNLENRQTQASDHLMTGTMIKWYNP